MIKHRYTKELSMEKPIFTIKSLFIGTRFVCALSIVLLSVSLSGCGKQMHTLNQVEEILDERPSEALAMLDSLGINMSPDSRIGSRYTLLYSIALAKNHIKDGRIAKEMGVAVDWFNHHGTPRDRLRAIYYYGDQLLGAGLNEDAAVQFLLSEKMAAAREDWYIAGLSARGLYYCFAKTRNVSEELDCITRALDYFQKAGLEAHEDDARIKQGMAYYDNSMLEKSDSVFTLSIGIATEKKDTVRLIRALVQSVDVYLAEGYINPEGAISSLSKAETLGYKPDSRAYAYYALAYALIGRDREAKDYIGYAYDLCKNNTEQLFVSSREYRVCIAEGDSTKAFDLIKNLNSGTNSIAIKALEQSAIKAQKAYLESVNNSLSREVLFHRKLIVICSLLLLSAIIIVYLAYKRISERHRIETQRINLELQQQRLEEAGKLLEVDRYHLAYEEIASFGLESFDIVGRAYYSSENSPLSVVKAYESRIMRLRDEKYLDQFIDSIDKTHNDIVSTLNKEIPGLSKSRLALFAFLVQGFSYTTISVILDCNQRQNLYDMRKRLVEKIKKSSPEHKQLFLSYLEKE